MGLPRERMEAPPRTIPPTLAAQMALGGVNSQIGWFLFAFGSIFFWVFGWQADLTNWQFRKDATGTVDGNALGCRATSYTVGGSNHRRGTPVYENRYRYSVAESNYEGRSYATGKCLSSGPVTVEYLLTQPSKSRISGMRHSLLSPWALLVLLFPGAGLATAAVGLWRGRLRCHLLRCGIPAAGLVTERSPTGSRTRGKMVYRVTLEFTARDGSTHSTTIKTNQPERLSDDKPETVLFDPENPDCALPLEGLPGSLSLDHAGHILPDSSRAYLFLPVVSLLLNAWLCSRNW